MYDAPVAVDSCHTVARHGPCVVLGGGEAKKIQPDAPQLLELDCQAIGDGAGVSCLFESTEGTMYPPPFALLLGVDPDRPGIRMLWIDSSGNAREYARPLSGDTAKLEPPCIPSDCDGQIRVQVHAPIGGKPVEMTIAKDQRPDQGPGRLTCVATTRITARRGADSVRLQVEIRMDGRVTSRYDVEQVRVKQPAR
jgi:hypothetical protein